MKTAALALTLFLAQDEAKLAELIRLLGSEEIQTREKAEKELLAVGAPAYPALERAMKDKDPEIRSRAKSIHGRMRRRFQFEEFKKQDLQARWKSFRPDFQPELSAQERGHLDSVPAFSAALRVPECGNVTEEKELPETAATAHGSPWQFLDSKPFTPAVVLRGEAADGTSVWRVRSERFAFQFWRLPKERIRLGHASGFFIVEPLDGRFELTRESVRRNPPRGAVASLSEVARPEGWNHLHSQEGQIESDGWNHLLGARPFLDGNGKLRGAYYTFGWDQDKPFASLRHLFVKESFALFEIGYQ